MEMMEYMTTRKDDLVGWVRKFSLFPYPFVTACCGMEFMSVSSTLYDTDRFGAALPRFTPRQSDLLMVVGTISHKQAHAPKAITHLGSHICSQTRRRMGACLCVTVPTTISRSA